MPIRFVFFDATGTLIHLREPVGVTYGRQARRFGFAPARRPGFAEEVTVRFLRELGSSPPLAFPNIPEKSIPSLEILWWRRLVAASLGGVKGFAHFDEFFDTIYRDFASAKPWRVDQGVGEALTQLERLGVPAGVLSNFDSRLESILSSLGLRGSFKVVLHSTRARYAKPDSRIFEAAVREAGFPAALCLHVGDSPQADFEGARTAGLKSVLLDADERWRGAFRPRIRRLEEVIRFLQ